MAKNKTQNRLGLFYRSHGRWIGPYKNYTFTEKSIGRNPIKGDISLIKNHVLKSRIKICKVG